MAFFRLVCRERKTFCTDARSFDYDLIIIGSGPAAQKCAVDSAKRNKRIAVIEKKNMLGGVCLNTGTIPSKTFREAVLHLTGFRHQGFYGKAYTTRKRVSFNEVLDRVDRVVRAQKDIIKQQLQVHHLDVFTGSAKFTSDPHRIQVTLSDDPQMPNLLKLPDDSGQISLTAKKFLIACGTSPARRSDIPFDGEKILDSDDILKGKVTQIPRDLIVIGAGVIGMEYASMINIFPGSHATVIDSRPNYLSFFDHTIIQTLEYIMRQNGARFLLGENIRSVEREGDKVIVNLESSKKIIGDCLLYTVGRKPNTSDLGLGALDGKIELTDRGNIKVNQYFQTPVPHIYAAGDVIGFPALASTSMEQGRIASSHMWGASVRLPPAGFPYGIYTIPEMSMIGKTEEDLTREKVQYEVGIARYEEVAKGQILGAQGLLKILFHTKTKKILGVHCIGEGATEIIHIGQVAMDMGETIYLFRDNVFNYPTFAEAYKAAAFNGLKRLNQYAKV